MRYAHVDWKVLGEKTHPEEEAEYLVVTDDNGEARYAIARWIKKGGTVYLARTEEELKKTRKELAQMDAITRLQHAIYGWEYAECEIKKDGFYVITRNYGFDEEYPGCAEFPDCLGTYGDTNVYWTELPLEPRGLLHPYEAEKEERLRVEEEQEVYEKRLKKALDDATKEGGLIDSFSGSDWKWRETCLPQSVKDDSGNTIDNAFTYPGVIFEADENLRNIIYAGACQAIETINAISQKITEEDVVKARQENRAGDSKLIMKLSGIIMREILDHDRIGIDGIRNGRYSKLLCAAILDMPYIDNGSRGFTEWTRRLMKYKWFQNLSIAEKIVVTDSFYRALFRLRRAAKLFEIGVPAVIKANEYRELCERFMYLLGSIKGYTKDFGGVFGFTTEGKYHDYYKPEEDEKWEDGAPEFDTSLPEFDELGESIPYSYDKENGKWMDMRPESYKNKRKKLHETISVCTAKLLENAADMTGKKFEDTGAFQKALTDGIPKHVYFESVYDDETRHAIKMSVDLGLYDIIIIAVITANDTDGLSPISIGFTPKDLESVGINIDTLADGDNVNEKTDIAYIIKPN